MEESGEHEADPPQNGCHADDEGDNEEGAEGKEAVVKEEDGKLGGCDGAAEEDLGSLVGLDVCISTSGGLPILRIHLDERLDLIQGQCDHMSAATRFDCCVIGLAHGLASPSCNSAHQKKK